jgi:hypothetical protein
LVAFDASDRAMGDLVVEAVVHGDDPLRVWVHAVDGEMEVEVAVLGVAMEGIDDLMLGEAHLVEEGGDGLVSLRSRGLLSLPPAQDPVVYGLGAAPRCLSEVDHLLHLALVVDVEHVLRSSVLDLLAVAASLGAGDVVEEGAHVVGLALGRDHLGRRDLLDDHVAPPGSRSPSLAMAAFRAVSAVAVCRL